MNAIRYLCLCAAVGLCANGLAAQEPKTTARTADAPKSADAAGDKAKAEPTHEKLTDVKVKGEGGLGLQTLCADASGRILALVAQSRYFEGAAKDVTSEVHVLTSDGKPVKQWKVAFHAHSINIGPDGTVFVAGDGKVAKFDSDGKALGQVELPHIADMLKDKEKMRGDAEKQLTQQREQFDKIKKQFTEQKEKLEKKKAEELTKQEERQLEQYKQILKSYEQTSDYYAKLTVEQVMAQTVSRLKVINGIAVSEKDLFLVCGNPKGYGYSIWRMTHDFKDAKQVNQQDVSGCCGQMDIQVAGTDYLLAENTNYKWARYDRDGKALGAWGKGQMVQPGKEPPPDCFGGCCNPMNVRVCKTGDVLTAESEGVIKRYSAKGDFLGTVAKVPLTGGCKNVAVAATPDAERVFFCDQPGSKVIILAKKKPKETTGGE
jgi:hypothetical protein